MSNSNKLFSSAVGKQAKHAATAVAAAHAAKLLTNGREHCFSVSTGDRPCSTRQFAAGLGGYGISSLLDGLFD